MRVLIFIIFYCFIILPIFIGADAPNFMDLSDIGFGVTRSIWNFTITFKTKMTAKIKSCTNCIIKSDTTATCEEDRLVATETEFSQGDIRISIPFNISCSSSRDDRNAFIISQIYNTSFPNNVSLWWDPPNDNIRNYLFYCITKSGKYINNTKGSTPSLNIKGLKEKTWYQICIASINDRWRTGRFKCQSVLTDFTVTGPITSVIATSEADRIRIGWSHPEYTYDIPQAYIVDLRGPSNMCRIVIIKLEDVDIPFDHSCQQQQTLSWQTLNIMDIPELDPFSKFNISITPFNRNKKSAKTYLSIVTKEGESDAVRNLKVNLEDPNDLFIQFLEPSRPQGNIIEYKIKIRSIQRNICLQENVEVHTASFQRVGGQISKNVLKRCGPHLLEVFPVNGWSQNNGIGKPASITFDHRINMDSVMKVDAKFVASNFLRITLKDIHSNDKCEILGFVIEVRNEDDLSNCITRRITSVDCEEIENGVRKISKCPNIRSSQFNKQSTNLELIFSGFFQDWAKYRIKTWRITDKFDEVSSQEILAEDIKDCFTDCYNAGKPYLGIQSATKAGEVCIPWKDSPYPNYVTVKSNICTMEKSTSPWCPISLREWKPCDVPQCSSLDIGTGCVEVNNVNSSTDYVRINWSAPDYNGAIIGYIILLHNTNYECIRYHLQLCDTCGSEDNLENRIKAHYLSCKTRERNVGNTNEVSFMDLHQDRQYIVYIIPIINKSNIGQVKNITISTKLARPDIPKNIIIQSISLHEIEVSWDKTKETRQYGITNYYNVRLKNVISQNVIQNSLNKEKIKEMNLEVCTEYCAMVCSINNAGWSEYSRDVCTFTLAPKPSKVVLEDLQSGYKSSQVVRWKYSGSDKCPKMFLVEYQIKDLTNSINSIRTNHTSIEMTHLKKNRIYSVKMRSEGLLKTLNDEKLGEFSEIKEFYTGINPPSIQNLTEDLQKKEKKLNISWLLHPSMEGAIFEYMVQVKDSSKKCLQLIHFICKDCEEPLNHKYFSKEQTEKRNETLQCAHSQIKTFVNNQTSFSYAFTFKDKLSNLSVEIFGSNMMGLHSLSMTNRTIPNDESGSTVMVALLIIAILLIISLIILLVFIRQKQSPPILYNLFFARKESRQQEHIVLTRTKKSLIETSSVTDRENNGDLPKKASSKKLEEVEENPLTKPKPAVDLSISNKKINTAIALTGFAAHYEQASLNGSAKIVQEYKKLTSEARALESSLGLTVEAGKDSAVAKKNRFINILPYDQNRVKVGEKGFPRDYINASYIPFANDVDTIEYIASQGPIDGSMDDFWQMIWEQNVNCVLMLTRTMEGDKLKCLQYWPSNTAESLLYGNKNQFNVTLLEEEEKESHIERRLEVENTKINEKRQVVQIHMHTWFDHAAPNLDHFDKMLFRFHEITNENINYPYLVHCSAGVGRTGTLICIDRIIKELINGSLEIDIYDRVLKLRKYRNFMVQRQAQYVFIYDYINHFLSTYMKISEGEEPLYFNEG